MHSNLNNKRPEILSPAGDFERLIAAVEFGADAVYLGSDIFGMRATPKNFGFDELAKATEYAHLRGVKVYLTCNTTPHNDEINKYPDFIKQAYECGIDAAIVSDIGVLALTKKIAPDLEIHISTQAGIVNHITANEFYNMGAKRVVLARELSLVEIADMRSRIPKELDIEVFVHGSMCVSFSGRCLLSNYMINRDANRGECAQPCRWGYHLVEEKRPNEHYPIFEDERGTYILNAKDLCMIEHIDKLVDAGISSFKIEGRAKSFYYVSTITNAYRCALDHYLKSEDTPLPSWIVNETKKVSHRQYSTGFFFGHTKNSEYYENSGYVRDYDIVGVVDHSDGHFIHVTQRNKFYVGDEVEILSPLKEPVKFKIEQMLDCEGNPLDSAPHAEMKLKIPSKLQFEKYSIIRRQNAEN